MKEILAQIQSLPEFQELVSQLGTQKLPRKLGLSRAARLPVLLALQQAHAGLMSRRQAAPLLAAVVYVLLYVVVTALSLPGAAVFTLAGGAIVGLGLGLSLRGEGLEEGLRA